MVKVQISAMIEPNDYEEWKRLGLQAGHIFKLGLLNARETPGYVSRIRDVEEGNMKLQQRLTYALNRIRELEQLEQVK